MTLSKKLLQRIAAPKITLAPQNILIVPYWQDSELFSVLHNHIHKSGKYVIVHKDSYDVPKESKAGKASSSFDTLVDLYGMRAIQHAYGVAKDHNSTIALLYGIRGFGRLGIDSTFYQQK
jgi:hypothetical protein